VAELYVCFLLSRTGTLVFPSTAITSNTPLLDSFRSRRRVTVSQLELTSRVIRRQQGGHAGGFARTASKRVQVPRAATKMINEGETCVGGAITTRRRVNRSISSRRQCGRGEQIEQRIGPIATTRRETRRSRQPHLDESPTTSVRYRRASEHLASFCVGLPRSSPRVSTTWWRMSAFEPSQPLGVPKPEVAAQRRLIARQVG